MYLYLSEKSYQTRIQPPHQTEHGGLSFRDALDDPLAGNPLSIERSGTEHGGLSIRDALDCPSTQSPLSIEVVKLMLPRTYSTSARKIKVCAALLLDTVTGHVTNRKPPAGPDLSEVPL